VVQIFRVGDSAIWGNGDLEVLLALEAKFLQRKRVNVRSQNNIGKGWYISVPADKICRNSKKSFG
jgi:hypothetical protein